MALEGVQQGRYALHEAIVDQALVLVDLDVELALLALLVNLILLGPDEGLFVDIGVDFDVGVIAELKRVLRRSRAVGLANTNRRMDSSRGASAHPFTVVYRHLGDILDLGVQLAVSGESE